MHSHNGRPTTPRGQVHDSQGPAGGLDLSLSILVASSTEASPRISNGNPSSPVRFATSKNAFGLTASPASSSSSSTAARDDRNLLMVEQQSPPSAGAGSVPSGKTRMRRPSMLSLAQTASFGSESDGGGGGASTGGTGAEELIQGDEITGPPPPAPPSSAASSLTDRGGVQNPFAPHPLRFPPQWGSSGFAAMRNRQASASHLTFEGLSTTTPPNVSSELMEDQGGSGIEADMEDQPRTAPLPLRWMPSHLQSASARRKGKARMEDQHQHQLVNNDSTPQPEFHKPPFTGRPLPASLVATLISESAPGDHEIQSEARLQRLITSHPRALPFTPRVSRSSRGRFPEMVGDDDDEDDFPSRRAIWASRAWTRRDSSSDSDSDDMGMPMDEGAPESVNSAFAAGMDMDRGMGTSISMSEGWPGNISESGKSTPGMNPSNGNGNGSNGHPTPPSIGQAWDKSRPTRMSFSGMGMVPSPGTGFGLPTAFGGLGMGIGTPIGSPTIERLELAASPNAPSAMPSTASPSLMQYRESSGGSASVRPGKRKAQVDDRFDPYKRPRGSSPSFSSGSTYPMSPSRSTPAIPIPQSPSYHLFASMLSTSTSTQGQGGGREQINLRTKPNHPYTRPMSSRSRAASPALSVGSNSGVLASSLGSGGLTGTGGRERGSFSLGGAFIPTGQGPGNGAAATGVGSAPPPALGGLGLLSLAGRGEEVEMIKEEGEGEDMQREDDMEED